ncbi:MAG: DUF4147 domain-containing protein [Acidobacteriota bacterium]|nr:DUF4147 domain-containing protein [Acidobacteriota bacterium]
MLTRYGHAGTEALPPPLQVMEGGHPVPDAKGVAGTAAMRRLLEGASGRTLVLFLISGGGSALLVQPAAGLSLEDKRQATESLLRCGAEIGEINAVRKHLSAIKGGRAARLAAPAGVLALIVSDVIGDRLDVIASGPTTPDSSSYAQALAVLRRHRISHQVAPAVIAHLEKGAAGDLPETPGPDDPLFDRVENILVAGNRLAVEAAVDAARQAGWPAQAGPSDVQGEARRVGVEMARLARTLGDGPCCRVSGGETTVHVRGPGRGGRNMELALAFAIEIAGAEAVTLLSAGTDGSDGPTDAAGAMVDGRTVPRALSRGLDPRVFLERNDSYEFFRRAGGLLVTGPTGTNVMDLQILLVGRAP